MPANPLMTWFNRLAVNRVRRNGRFMGMRLLALTTVGAKSGVTRTTPVAWFPGHGGGWVIVASAGGGPRNPAWFHNLLAHPDQVVIEVDGQRVPVTPLKLQGPERDAALRAIYAESPRFAGYEKKTSRVIPVVRLLPRGR